MGQAAAASLTGAEAKHRRRNTLIENIAAVGMLLICAGLMIPLFKLSDPDALEPFKWLYTAGAVIFTAARAAGACDRSGSKRMIRLRRMEFWGGVAFILAAAIWFYKEQHLGPYVGPLAVIKDSILFTLVGACIQVIAAWLIYSVRKKESVL